VAGDRGGLGQQLDGIARRSAKRSHACARRRRRRAHKSVVECERLAGCQHPDLRGGGVTSDGAFEALGCPVVFEEEAVADRPGGEGVVNGDGQPPAAAAYSQPAARGRRSRDPGERAGSVHRVIIRDARPDEYAAVGELRVTAYRALGLLPAGSGYADTLRGFGFGDDCVVLVAADNRGDDILGTITLEPFDPTSELALDDTEADIRAFAVAPDVQGRGVGRKLLLAVIECAEKRGLRRLRLCTQPVMRTAQHLYESTGFSRTPELDFDPVPGLTLQAYELALPLASASSL
jgi:ribosomal protein S18 acetylase RimI-like enzyme